MWGKRQIRYVRLSRRRALGLLAEMMAQAEQQVSGEPEAVPYPVDKPAPAVLPARAGLLAADVPVDNSAGPEAAAAADNSSPQQWHPPTWRTGDSARHDTVR